VAEFHIGIGRAVFSPPATKTPFVFATEKRGGRVVRNFLVSLDPIIITIWLPQRKLSLIMEGEADENFFYRFEGFIEWREDGRMHLANPVYLKIYY